MATKVTTAWGDATVLEEVTLPQEAPGRRFASVVQLLAGADGARYVRFAYTTDGTARRGPVTLRAEDLTRLHRELAERAELAAALGIPARTKGGAQRKRA
jgi:hypothetical protein